MKSKSPKNTSNTLPQHIDEFNVGDLIIYAPHFHDADGPWVMSGDMGIIIESKTKSDYQIVKVKWINFDMGETDMSTEVLKKITLDKEQ